MTLGGHELDSVGTATTVRVRGDETLVTDGPFVESKEALGGYYVFECDSIDEACKLGGEDPGRQARRDRGAAGPRRRRGGSMKYVALLTNTDEEVAAGRR